MSARDVSKLRTRLRALARRARQPGPKLEDLPPDMLREISDRLPPGDARRFSGVSSAVRTAVRDRAGAPLPYDPDYTPTDYARNKATNNFEWAWDWGFDEAEDDGRMTVRYEAPDGRVYEAETHAPPPSSGVNYARAGRVNYGAPWASLDEIRPPGQTCLLYLRDYRDSRDPYYSRVFKGSIVVETSDGPIDRRALALLLELVASRWGLHKRDVARSFRLFLHDDEKEEVGRSNFEDLLSVLRELQDTNPDFGKQTAPRRPQ